jgi:DNA-binding NtrC family response regulator
VDFRVVAATNRDLHAMTRSGEFREELYWRLNVFTIEIPPLAQRKEDIPLLAEHFVERFSRSMNRRGLALSPEAMQVLTAHSWPGNVRELQNAIERAVALASPPLIQPQDLPVRLTRSEPARPGPGSLSEMEKIHIQAVLDSTGWNISQAARILEIDRVTLYNKIRKYELKKPSHAA